MKQPTTTRQFFENKYRGDADPWYFATDAYEQARYGSILRALIGDPVPVGHPAVSALHTSNKPRYRRAFEPGCSIGVLTEKLAPICDELYAMDISPTATAEARKRCRHLANVHIFCGALPESLLDRTLGLPEEQFDLIVFSEIGYYFEPGELPAIGQALTGRLTDGGTLLAAHWLGESPDHLVNGDFVHRTLASLNDLHHESSELHPGFRLDRWTIDRRKVDRQISDRPKFDQTTTEQGSRTS